MCVEPFAGVQDAADGVDVVFHSLFVGAAQHLGVCQEGEVADGRAERAVVVRHPLVFAHDRHQALRYLGLAGLRKCSGGKDFRQRIVHLDILETVHGTHLRSVGKCQHKQTVGLDGLTWLEVDVVTPLFCLVCLIFHESVDEILWHVISLFLGLYEEMQSINLRPRVAVVTANPVGHREVGFLI